MQVEENEHVASHVEITFRDAYLTRGDMWRLVSSELAGRTMYKGQRILFLNSIKAQIKSIYRRGERSSSGLFGVGSKPIFRSESARYIIFIQMSREMWEFEPEGSGEIMFNKVINGFLPELFAKWREIGARHLLSIILFTRMEYNRPKNHRGSSVVLEEPRDPFSTDRQEVYRDFYRVLVSDMASGQWSAILAQLKKDFKDFLRDVSISPAPCADALPTGSPGAMKSSENAMEVITGRPAPAARGNILEALNLASSQFSEDYIDRDLVRTGLSIVVISPGPGIFEVNAGMLGLTTDLLIENGVGIDLVCLSRMPLHSVPLFKYKPFEANPDSSDTERVATKPKIDSTSGGENLYGLSGMRPLLSREEHPEHREYPSKTDEWHYAIPHWVDISFWNRPVASLDQHTIAPLYSVASSRSRPFVPRVRMYEIQMMGIMGNEVNDVGIPALPALTVRTTEENGIHASSLLQARESVSSISSSYRKSEAPRPKVSDGTSTSFSPKSPLSLSNIRPLYSLIQQMDDHDKTLFTCFGEVDKNGMSSDAVDAKPLAIEDELKGEEILQQTGQQTPTSRPKQRKRDRLVDKHLAADQKPEGPHRKSSTASSTLKLLSTGMKQSKTPRQSSFGFRGFGGPVPKAMPITEVSSEVAHRESLLTRGLQQAATLETTRLSLATVPRNNGMSSAAQMPYVSESAGEDFTKVEQQSKPIDIRKHGDKSSLKEYEDRDEAQSESGLLGNDSGIQLRFEIEAKPIETCLSETTTPWLTILNPSNPRATRVDPSSRLGRWHHVFPKPLHASSIKWKSLCSPASIPLTTEGFPPPEQFPTEYEITKYRVSSGADEKLEKGERQKKLLREMVYARFSRGFQVVIGPYLSSIIGDTSLSNLNVFDEGQLHRTGASIFMSRGTHIHQLTKLGEGMIEVKLHLRRSTINNAPSILLQGPYAYKPSIRTPLSDRYEPRHISISTAREPVNWKSLDTFIAGHEEQLQLNIHSDIFKAWRARYVFIPMQHSSNMKRSPSNVNEDNEEEIRLEGIYKLTQLWQRNKYVVPADDHSYLSKRKVESLNPLDITFRTHTASSIVESELHDSLLQTKPNDKQPRDLLPESELFDKTALNLASLAQTLQGERGVRLQDRRWHWRLHYNCFIGIELVTWLLENFRDVNTREEAVELGNELMQEGLFVHVEKRHNFRDGNFFYQISPEYRTPRTETRGTWFNRLSSLPSTPIAEKSRGDANNLQLQSDKADESDAESSTPTETEHHSKVQLSKKLIYDVDKRKRSYRSEIFNLHYDRISSADDCYHVRIDWMNVTPKLIEDAVASWASAAERYGLRLVELPINEASRVNELHAFRSPYIIKLSKRPPEVQLLGSPSATSLEPRSTGNYPFHKAILGKFDFVLDMEAAKDFPASVDVTYSWGKPDYRYPQYIAREGVLLVQITDEGDFLLLANRLYNNRGAMGKASSRMPVNSNSNMDGFLSRKSPLLAPSSKLPPSPSESPRASPMIRATPDVGPGMSKSGLITPEGIKDELEAFCSDPRALEKFYEEIVRQAALESPKTPVLEGLGGNSAMPPNLALGRSLLPGREARIRGHWQS